MVDKTKKILKKFTPIGKMGKEPLILPNHSGYQGAQALAKTPTKDFQIANKKYVDDEIAASPHTPEGTAIKSTGEGGGTKFLREDGDNSCSWQTAGAVPAGNDTEIQFNDSGSFGGDSNLTWNKTNSQLLLNDGTKTLPCIAAKGNTDVGMYFSSGGNGSVNFSVSNSKMLQVTSSRILVPAGTYALPGINMGGANGDGIVGGSRDMGISVDGKEHFRCFRSQWVWVNRDLNNIDFNVSGDTDSSLLHVDAGLNMVGIGTATPTTKLSVEEKGGMTAIGGFAIKLTNTTGAVTIAGQLVKADPATNDAFILAAAGDTECFGVVLDAGVADAAEAWIVVSGIADVAFDDNVTAVRGNWVATGVLAGYAATQASPAAAPTHFEEIGHCIENVTGGGGGTHILARCVLHFN